MPGLVFLASAVAIRCAQRVRHIFALGLLLAGVGGFFVLRWQAAAVLATLCVSIAGTCWLTTNLLVLLPLAFVGAGCATSTVLALARHSNGPAVHELVRVSTVHSVWVWQVTSTVASVAGFVGGLFAAVRTKGEVGTPST